MFDQIKIGGSDAVEFLQGQLTQDVTRLAADQSLPAAWCNPKGRVIATGRLIALDDALGLVVAASLAEALVQRLSMFRFRADVTIERAAGDWQAGALCDERALDTLAAADLLPTDGAVCRKHGLLTVCHSGPDRFVEIFGSADAMADRGLSPDVRVTDTEWRRLRIRAGLADIDSENTEKYTPHMLNLDRVGAISFNKGCYTGQEVVARTENLGESKRRSMRYHCDAGSVAIGDRLATGERDVGTVVNTSGAELLAVVPVALHDQTLTLNGFPATPHGLPYDL